MKYLVRSLKYFVWFSLIFTIIMLIMTVLDVVEADPDLMFRDGMKSIWQIAALFFVFALVYPLTGFRKQEAVVPGEWKDVRNKVVSYMESKGYDLESEEGEMMTFRLHSLVGRAFKMFEDRITMTKSPMGVEVEGLRKVIVRVISGLEYSFRNENADNYSK